MKTILRTLRKRLLPALCCVALVASLMPTAFARSTGFTDVPENYWARADIDTAVDMGFINGMGDGTFNPEGKITYAQFAHILTKAFFANMIGTPTYKPHWYSDTWYTLANKPLCFFLDADPITEETADSVVLPRKDMALLIGETIREIDYSKVPSDAVLQETAARIPDIGNYEEGWVRDGILISYALGLMNGVDEAGNFDGYSGVTRAQAAVILLRLYDCLDGKVFEW